MLGFLLRSITACFLVLELGAISARADNAEVALLRGGADGLRARIQMLRRCKEGDAFYFTTYMISDDIAGRALMYELVQAADRGCVVRGIADPFHVRLPIRYHHYLQANGVHFREFRPITYTSLLTDGLNYVNNRIHEKLWVLDPGGASRRRNIAQYLSDVYPLRPPGEVPEMISGSGNLVGETFALYNGGAGVPGATNYIELDFIARGRLVEEVISHHRSLWYGGHVKRVRLRVPNAMLKRTAAWVEQGHRELFETLGITSSSLNHPVARRFFPTTVAFFRDDMFTDFTPEGSEVAIFRAVREARGGDWVEVAGRRVLYTPELYELLERTPLGQEIEIAGQRLLLTPEIKQAFANANPADDLMLINQYLILTPEFAEEMRSATARGVRIRAATNGPANTSSGLITRMGYLFTFNQLVATGSEIYEYNGRENIHAKAIVRKNVKHGYISATLGTANIDPRSLDQSPVAANGSRLRIPLLRNLEVNFHVNSPEFAALVGEEIELRFATSQLVARSGRAYAPRSCPWLFRHLFRSRTIFNML